MVGKLYTIDCGAYGKFLVSKEQYDSVNVGDDIPSYLKERGN
ncbi:Phage protein [Streptococcus sp. HSISS2]|nr:Phage protein [Streptococcus sp. HSISS2]